jgi:hypothetical protein
MLGTFDYFMTATDPDLGLPSDENRLVQRWSWYSLNDKRFEGYTTFSHLFDPYTDQITPLGLDFEAYVTPYYTPYVDLVPARLSFSPAAADVASGQAVSVTLTAMVRNGGNTDVQDVSVQFWIGDPSNPVGEAQAIDLCAARSLASVSVDWPAAPPGTHTVGVTVDGEDSHAESDEGNNQLTRALLVGGHRSFLPFSFHGR